MPNIRELKPQGPSLDLSDVVCHECVCGSNLWSVFVSFEDYEISSYFTDMTCAVCGTTATAPTPLDRPEEI